MGRERQRKARRPVQDRCVVRLCFDHYRRVIYSRIIYAALMLKEQACGLNAAAYAKVLAGQSQTLMDGNRAPPDMPRDILDFPTGMKEAQALFLAIGQ